MTVIIGINCYLHDTSVALIKDGQVIVAVEEERFNRQRHAPGICLGGTPPYQSLDWILKESGFRLEDIQKFAYSGRLLRKNNNQVWQAERNEYELFARSLDPRLENTVFYSHHLCHAAGAYLCSGYKDALIITADGGGDSISTALYLGKGNQIIPLISYPVLSSLGHLYSNVTRFVGLGDQFGQEGKTMALAGFGKPLKLPNVVYRNSLGYVISDRCKELISKNEVDYRNNFIDAANLAAWVQEELEKTINHLISIGINITGVDRICLSGGIFLNCKLNETIARRKDIRDIYIPSAPNDGGTSLGAALLASNEYCPLFKNRRLEVAALGPGLDDSDIDKVLRCSGFKVSYSEDPHKVAANLLVKSKIIGWMQGRMEFGPRALGNRSILADPRDPITIEKLVAAKNREHWRPYAPAIKRKKVKDWFKDVVNSPFMNISSKVLSEKRNQVPAIIHVDGSARIQTVTEGDCLYPLLDEFEKATNIPMVVNTSLNCQTPIIQSIKDGISLLATSPMDVLIIGNRVIEK